jgi:hypothetical protein
MNLRLVSKWKFGAPRKINFLTANRLFRHSENSFFQSGEVCPRSCMLRPHAGITRPLADFVRPRDFYLLFLADGL